MSSALATPHARTTTPTTPPVTLYWRVSGFALAAVAALGILLTAVGAAGLLGEGFLAFDWTHNLVHLALAATALALGYARVDLALSRALARVVGVVYVALGLAGFVPPVVGALDGLLGLHLELGENLVHLVVGAGALYAASAGRRVP